MRTIILLSVTILFQTSFLYGQLLKGKITDMDGNAVPGAAVFIKELSQGIAADDRGEFQTNLKSGNYSLEISSLGYERKTVPVAVGNKNETLTIQLNAKVYSLKGVTVTNKEDPAYPVMRKAIAKAPYHLRQVNGYNSQSYVKGSLKIDKIPKLIGNMKVDDTGKKVKDYSGKLYLVEAHLEAKYKAPDSYEIKTLAYSSAAPKDIFNGDAQNLLPKRSIYSPRIDEWVSPLAPDAFSYYRFKYEGISQEGNLWVNKIKVTPIRKNQKLVAGWIYIAENTWHLMHVDITGTVAGVTQQMKINYNEVKPSVFMPASSEANVNIDIMGIKATFKIYASSKYLNIETNEKLVKAEATPEVKEIKTNREAVRAAKKMKEAVEPKDTATRKAPFEIKPLETKIKKTADSLARTRDTSYWASIRDLPLREEEIQSYVREEAVKASEEKKQSDAQNGDRIGVSVSTGGSKLGGIIFGEGVSIGKKTRLSYSGLTGIVPEYNFVDGFWLGQRFNLRYRPNDRRQLNIMPEVYYVTARQAVNWKLASSFKYAPMRNGELKIAGGSATSDFNRETGNSRLINSLASLLLAENHIRFYHKNFLEIGNSVEAANGFFVSLNLAYEKRRYLENRTTFSFFSGPPRSNLPFRMLWDYNPEHEATIATVGLEYTPAYFYRVSGNRKRYVSSAFPTFGLLYAKAIPVFGNSDAASFDRIEATVRQKIEFDMFNSFAYRLNAGTHLSSDRLYFVDYKHFPTAQLPVTTQAADYSFSLLGDYNNSTSGSWLQAHVTYTSNYLLLKNLPFLQTYLFDEALHLRTLLTDRRDYFEAGYTIGFGDMGRAGVFVGSNRFRYLAAGITVSLSLLNFQL